METFKKLPIRRGHHCFGCSPTSTTGRVIEVKGRREALLEGAIVGESGDVCARSRGTLVLFEAEVAGRLNIMDEKALKMFMQVIGEAP